MKIGETIAKSCTLVFAGALFSQFTSFAQQKPLARSFSPVAEERYQVAISLRAQTQTISTDTVGSKTYVMPVVHEAEVRLKWRATRRIHSMPEDRSAQVEEDIADTGECEEIPQR